MMLGPKSVRPSPVEDTPPAGSLERRHRAIGTLGSTGDRQDLPPAGFCVHREILLAHSGSDHSAI